MCNFVGMVKEIVDYIREDEAFRQILLKQDGGIMKYWAEHPDSDFDIDLFEGYEEQIVEYYRQANKTNREICSMSKDELKRKARDWYRLTEKEIGFGVKLYQELTCAYMDVANLVETCIWDYLKDAYKDYRRMCAPNGITPKDFYEEALRQFQAGGLAVDCMDFILREHQCPEEWQKNKNEYTLTREFFIYQYIDAYYRDGGYRKLRQGVREKLEGKSSDDCRREVIKMLKAVKGFSHMLYAKTEPTHVRLIGLHIEYTVDKEWLLDVARPLHYISSHAKDSLRSCFSDFVGILEDIGRIWAARLLKEHHIDIRELEEETGCILYPVLNPMKHSHADDEDIYRYYVDKDYGDPLDDECCIYDEREAKELLHQIRVKAPHVAKQITWEDKKQCFKTAVLNVMERKKPDGNYLLERDSQWIAIYRFAVDIAIMYEKNKQSAPEGNSPQYKTFSDFAHEHQLDVNPPTRLPFEKEYISRISKDSYQRYNSTYPWPQDGITDARSYVLYTQLEDVYMALKEEYENLVHQKEQETN